MAHKGGAAILRASVCDILSLLGTPPLGKRVPHAEVKGNDLIYQHSEMR
jgi:hypothetical protein